MTDRPTHMDKADKIGSAVKARVEQELEAYPDASRNNGKIHSLYVQQCLQANELGSGLLYTAVCRDKFIYNATAGEWLRWTGQYWELDQYNQHLASVELVVDRLLEEMRDLSEKVIWAVKKKDKEQAAAFNKQINVIQKRISHLRSDRGRGPCIKFAISCKEPLVTNTDLLDLDPWLLGCPNGVIDLRVGKFKDGRPDQYITKIAPTPWKGLDEPCEQWEQFLQEIFLGDEEILAYMHKLLGYAITGLSREHILPVFWGRGRNGKGTMVNALLHTMGALAGSIKTELLLYQKMQRSSAGPDPDIVDLKGLRMGFASETEPGQKFSASKVKQITGGNQLVGRNLNEKRLQRFMPTHTIFLDTNDKPVVAGDDYAFWKRIHLIPFKLSFVLKPESELEENERMADPDLGEKLKAEASGILAWLVKGCLRYQKEGGLYPLPQVIKDATLEYQQDEDLLGQFIEAYCIKSKDKTQSAVLYGKFNRWYKEAVYSKGISSKKFGGMMKKRFDYTKINGKVYYKGIELDMLKMSELPGED